MIVTAALAALPLLGCKDSVLAGLEGRWEGTIQCFGQQSTLALTLSVDGDTMIGSGQTRTRDNNTNWSVRGAFATSCAEDTCTDDLDCRRGFRSGDASAGELRKCVINKLCTKNMNVDPRCSKKGANCNPCDYCSPNINCQVCDECREDWLPLKLTLRDEAVQLDNPEFKLWRYGDTYMRGTVLGFCADEQALHPDVQLSKQ